MVKDLGFIGMLHEDTERLLLILCRAPNGKDVQDLTGMCGDNMCTSFPRFEST